MKDDDFSEFAASRLGRLSRIAFLLTGDHHGAEDLVQSTSEKVAEHWKRVSRVGSPDAYARRILCHEHISVWRRTRMETSTESPPEPSEGDAAEAVVVRRLMLRRALAKLTPRQRAVVVLRFYEDLSVTEAAQALGCSEGTVMRHT